MAFIGIVDGSPVSAVEHNGDADCSFCGTRMYFTSSHRRGGSHVSAHYSHYPESSFCGESPEHVRMKIAAASWASGRWPGAEVDVECSLEPRRADVLFELPGMDDDLGHGFAIEVQYMHESKEKRAVERDYLCRGYSTLWLHKSDFGDNLKSVVDDPGTWFTVRDNWHSQIEHKTYDGYEPGPPAEYHIPVGPTRDTWPMYVPHRDSDRPSVFETIPHEMSLWLPDQFLRSIAYETYLNIEYSHQCGMCDKYTDDAVAGLCVECAKNSPLHGGGDYISEPRSCGFCGDDLGAGDRATYVYKHVPVHVECFDPMIEAAAAGEYTMGSYAEDWWQTALDPSMYNR